MPIWFSRGGGGGCGCGDVIVNVNHGVTDLKNLIYAINDADAAVKGVALKSYYLASEDNVLGVKYGTVLRREY